MLASLRIISASKKAIRENQRTLFVVQSCSVDTPASFGLVGLASTHATQCPCSIVCIAFVGQVEVKYADYQVYINCDVNDMSIHRCAFLEVFLFSTKCFLASDNCDPRSLVIIPHDGKKPEQIQLIKHYFWFGNRKAAVPDHYLPGFFLFFFLSTTEPNKNPE